MLLKIFSWLMRFPEAVADYYDPDWKRDQGK